MPPTISASPADSVRVFEISSFVELWPYLREAGWSCQRDPKARLYLNHLREDPHGLRPCGWLNKKKFDLSVALRPVFLRIQSF